MTSISEGAAINHRRRGELNHRSSHLAMAVTLATTLATGAGMLIPGTAFAACTVGGTDVVCGTTQTTDTAYPIGAPDDRLYQAGDTDALTLGVATDAAITGNGIALQNTGTGGAAVTNKGAITVDAGNSPALGGSSAVSVIGAGGEVSYTGSGTITNNGVGAGLLMTNFGTGPIVVDTAGDVTTAAGDGIDAIGNIGSGDITITQQGMVDAAGGNGIYAEQGPRGGNIVIARDQIFAEQDGILAVSQSLQGSIAITTNDTTTSKAIAIEAQLLPADATGDVTVIANGQVTGNAGIVAVNGGSGAVVIDARNAILSDAAGGIFAQNNLGDITIDSDDVTSFGGTAIKATRTGLTDGAVTIRSHDSINSASGIDAYNAAGTIDILSEGSLVADTGDGIHAETGHGAISIAGAGPIVAAETGVFAQINDIASSDDIHVVTTSDVSGKAGIFARTYGLGDVVLEAQGSVTAAGDEGIAAVSYGGNITIDSAAVTADGRTAIDAQQYEASLPGDIVIRAHGDLGGNRAINAVNAGGDIDIAVEGKVIAANGVGIYGEAGKGNIVVSVANGASVEATGGPTIYTHLNGAPAGTQAIVTLGGAIQPHDDIGIYQTSTDGDNVVMIGAGGSIIGSATSGPAIFQNATGGSNVVINDGSIVVPTGLGIQQGVIDGDALADGTGSIHVGDGDGISMRAYGAGSLAVRGSQTIVSDLGDGIDARISNHGAGTIDIATSGGSISGTGGIFAATDGSGAITIATHGDVTGTVDEGIYVSVTGSAPMSITVDDGTISGFTGVTGFTAFAGSVVIGGNATVVGTLSNGIVGYGKGDISILNTGSVTSLGDSAILAVSTGSGNVVVSGSGDVQGQLHGIEASSVGGNTKVAPAANVTGDTGSGIVARAAGMGDVAVATQGTIVGALSGIDAGADLGNVAITANGDVRGTTGPAVVAVVGANGSAGSISVVQGAGSHITSDGDAAIFTDSTSSTGSTVITLAGEVTAPGKTGVQAKSSTGAITVNVLSSGSIDPDYGISEETVSGAMTVQNGGLVTGDLQAVRMLATGANATGLVVNSGTITSPQYAIWSNISGGTFTIDNLAGGVINGAIQVVSANSLGSAFNNAGIWNATGTSELPANWNNTGVTNMASGAIIKANINSVNSGTVSVAGTGTIATTQLTNNGLIELRDGVAGQGNLILNGAYAGSGAIGVDFNTATASADHVTISGGATGHTTVLLNRTGSGLLPNGFLAIIDSPGGGAADAFASDSLFTTGLLLESFAQNPDDGTQWGILQTANPAIGTIGGALGAVDLVTASMFDQPISLLVNAKSQPAPGTRQFGLWGRGSAGSRVQHVRTTVVSDSINGVFDSRLDTEGQLLQIGADLGLLNIDGSGLALHLGITGGAVNATAKDQFAHVATNSSFLGGYAFLTLKGFTLDAMVRREWRGYDVRSATLFGDGDTTEVDGSAIFAQVEASYRIGKDMGFAVTPHLRYEFGSSKIDPILLDGGSSYQPGEDNFRLGTAGAKLSYRFNADAKLLAEPFVDVTAVHDWSPRYTGTAVFGASPNSSISIDSYGYSSAVRYSAGIVARDPGGRLSAFATGSYTKGERVSAQVFSIGARYNF